MTGYNTDKIKVIIADDHPLLREGIIKILSLEPRIQVVGEAQDEPDTGTFNLTRGRFVCQVCHNKQSVPFSFR